VGNLYIADNSNRIRKISPALAITVNSPPLICAGFTTTLTANGATTYSWSPATGLSATTGSTVVASPTVTTSYTVTGFSGASAGVAISTVTVDLPPVTADSAIMCTSGSATLTASGATTYTWNTGATGAIIVASPTITTNYTVTGTDANGCTNSFSTTVQIISSPTVSFMIQKDTLTIYTWDVYPSYSTNVVNARWYWGDGSSTFGLYPSHTFSSPGMYNICLAVYNACGDSTDFCQNDSIYRLSNSTNSNMIQVNVINNTTDINQITNTQNSICKIFPNPAQNNFTIETSNAEKQNVSVFDINGKLILSQTIIGTTNIDASNFNAGVYNISIMSKGGIVNKRLVVVK
ncbi:MAG TPA: T9SS type A sorting domain-containing protein, partial [Bacteroidia bacterium]|nr:T9SS type A sorting domain-containing protein [Bacteroidia bacterium]